jgi:hypothetical protein
MDVTTAVLTGLGLATAAGLNAYIPLLVVGLALRIEVIDVSAPYDQLGATPVLLVIGTLLVIEVFSDKIPIVDSIGDVVGTVVRPAAGAVLFAGSIGVVDQPAWLGLALGVITAGSVHTAKATLRPVANVATGGLAAPVISTAEDGISLGTTLVALLAPLLVVVVLVVLVSWFVRRRRRGRGEEARPT